MSQASEFLSRLDGDIASLARALHAMGKAESDRSASRWTFEDGSSIEIQNPVMTRETSAPRHPVKMNSMQSISHGIRQGLWA